jgi:hypothetical protein
MRSAEDLRLLRSANPAPLALARQQVDRVRQRSDFASIVLSRRGTFGRAEVPKRRQLILVAAFALALIAAATPLAIATKLEVLPILDFSNRGEPATLKPEQDAAIRERNRQLNLDMPDMKWRFLGEAGNAWFYVGEAGNGGNCIALFFSSDSLRPGMLGCGRASSPSGPGFPIGRGPVLDLSAFRTEPGSGTLLTRMIGLAGDGVERVGVVNANGEVVWAKVVNNIYGLREVPSEAVVAIIAVDASGSRVYTKDVR